MSERDLVAELKVPPFTAATLEGMFDAGRTPGMFLVVDERAMKAAMRRGLVALASSGSYRLTELGREWVKQYRTPRLVSENP